MGQGMKRIKGIKTGRFVAINANGHLYSTVCCHFKESISDLLYVLAFFSAKAPNINKRIYSFSKAFPHRSPRAESSRLDGLILS